MSVYAEKLDWLCGEEAAALKGSLELAVRELARRKLAASQSPVHARPLDCQRRWVGMSYTPWQACVV